MAAAPRQRLSAVERRGKAVQLWLAAVDLRTIAKQVGYANAAAAMVAIERAIEESIDRGHDSIDAMRRDEVMRYDRLQAAFWTPAIKDKDPRAAAVVIQCIRGRVELQGTAAPKRVSVDAMQLGDQILAMLDDEDEAGSSP